MREVVPRELRSTPAWLSKYEKARVLGIRARQIEGNSPLYGTTEPANKSSLELAEKELYEKNLPFLLWRVLPDGSCEEWKLSEL